MTVTFVSGSLAELSNGFTATYKTAKSTPYCARRRIEPAGSGSFNDGSGDALYRPETFCSWVLKTDSPGFLQLNFTFIDLEAGGATITIFEGRSYVAAAERSGPFVRGNTTERNTFFYESTGSSVRVVFQSSGLEPLQGFEATYTTVRYCEAAQTLNATLERRNFTDGSGDRPYSDKTACAWVVHSSSGGRVRVELRELALEKGFDFVSVIDGASTKGSILGKFSGSYNASTVGTSAGDAFNQTSFISSEGITALTVYFVSNAANTGEGFLFEYWDVPPPEQLCARLTQLNTSEGTFDDGSGSQPYVENSLCAWLVSPPGNGSILLNFTFVDTEPGQDLIRVYDGPSADARLIAEISGAVNPEGRAVAASSGRAYVTFTSDRVNNFQGFRASYRKDKQACNGEIKLALDKLGSVVAVASNGQESSFTYLPDALCTWWAKI
eukprot:tig00020878_g14865.t1